MSAKELGSEGRWFGDDYERNGLFGNAPTQFGELREDFKPRSGEVASDLDQQFYPYQDDGRRPPVTMETASTGKPDIYGIKAPVRVISKSFIRFGFHFSALFVNKSTACWRDSSRRDAVWSICRRFLVTTDGPAC